MSGCNKLCASCLKVCKQFAQVKVLSCPYYSYNAEVKK